MESPNTPNLKEMMNKSLMAQPQSMPEKKNNNPFELSPYNDVNMPDQPIQQPSSMVDSLLNNDIVPAEILKRHWYIFHPDNVLTFLDRERKNSKLINFDILKIDTLNTLPYYDYNFDVEKGFNVLRNVFETKLDRSQGFDKADERKNERIILQSQFTEQRQISENNGGGGGDAWWKRLVGRKK